VILTGDERAYMGLLVGDGEMTVVGTGDGPGIGEA
jgi:hypothetical protein